MLGNASVLGGLTESVSHSNTLSVTECQLPAPPKRGGACWAESNSLKKGKCEMSAAKTQSS